MEFRTGSPVSMDGPLAPFATTCAGCWQAAAYGRRLLARYRD